ncbi:hypothetical protein OROGR_006766 [Orobanche gracilis]
MASKSIHEKGRPLPKFGEWDVNNPASADGFTVIFAKARDEKKAKGSAGSSGAAAAAPPPMSMPDQTHQSSCDNNHTKKKWLCCF